MTSALRGDGVSGNVNDHAFATDPAVKAKKIQFLLPMVGWAEIGHEILCPEFVWTLLNNIRSTILSCVKIICISHIELLQPISSYETMELS